MSDRAAPLTDPALLGALTTVERRILGRLARTCGVTQADLAVGAEFKQQTVSRAVGDLAAKGLVLLGERTSNGRRGQPSARLRLNAGAAHALGVSVMADAVAVTLVDMAGAARGETVCEPASMTRPAVLAAALEAGKALCAEAGVAWGAVVGVGVAITGFVLPGGRTFNPPRALDDWAGVDVAATFAAAFEKPAWADNDGAVAAVGESLVGVGRWARSFAYVYLATGLGGGLIVDGRLWRGVNGNAGEFAGVLPNMLYASPTLELLRHCFAAHDQPFARLSDMLAALDVEAPAVTDWLNRVGESLSLVCSAAHAVLDPDAIVIGGRAPRALAKRAIERIDLRLAPRRGQDRAPPKIVPAEAAGDAAALGAAVLPLQALVYGLEPTGIGA